MIKKNFGNHVSAKVLVSRTYKKVLQLSKMTNNPILKCVKNRHSSKKIYKWPISKWKYVQHHYPLANKTQWDCCHDGYNHKGKIISNADNNAKKPEPSHTAVWNEQWYGQFGKEFGNPSRSHTHPHKTSIQTFIEALLITVKKIDWSMINKK